MDQRDLCYLSVARLGGLIRDREVSPVEVAQAFLSRSEELEPRLNSYITLLRDESLAAARQAEKEVLVGNYRGPFHGIPVALKDLFHTKGVRTTSGSAVFKDLVSSADSAVVERFKRAGAYVIGKLNMAEFAYNPTGFNAHFGPVRNPWDVDRMSGGSSSGCGSAVAAGQCPIAMGSDTAGSIRIPGSLCGVVGYKPTYGLISRYGVVRSAWSLDHVGPLTRTVEDVALCLNVLAGHDARDAASASVAVPNYTQALDGDMRGLRIGMPKELPWHSVDPEVGAAVRAATGVMEKLGATVFEVSIPHFSWVRRVLSVILRAEAASHFRDTVLAKGELCDPLTRLRVEAGLFVPAIYYLKALRIRSLLNKEYLTTSREWDLLVTPTVPIAAPRYAAGEPGLVTAQVQEALAQFTLLFSLGGFPTISVPCGFNGEGLPIGLQMAGRPFQDATVLKAAHAYEQATDWHSRRPTL